MMARFWDRDREEEKKDERVRVKRRRQPKQPEDAKQAFSQRHQCIHLLRTWRHLFFTKVTHLQNTRH